MEAQAVPGNYICDMPVLFGPKTTTYSYGIAVTATIFWYYIASAIYIQTQKGASAGSVTGWSIGIYVAILLLQIVGIYLQSIYQKCKLSIVALVISWVVGFLVGIIFFLIIKSTDASYLPYMASTVESFTSQVFLTGGIGKPVPETMIKDPASSSASKDSEQSHKPDDKDEFVCDLYKNGQLITSTISE